MQLVVLEGLLRLDIANAMLLAHLQRAVSHNPPRGRVVLRAYPLVLVFSVEENDGIRRRVGVGLARCHGRRHRRVHLRILMLHLGLSLLRKSRSSKGYYSGDD